MSKLGFCLVGTFLLHRTTEKELDRFSVEVKAAAGRLGVNEMRTGFLGCWVGGFMDIA